MDSDQAEALGDEYERYLASADSRVAGHTTRMSWTLGRTERYDGVTSAAA
jgi:hypothetical protein